MGLTSHLPRRWIDVLLVCAVLTLAGIEFGAAPVPGGSAWTPLPWDISHHYLRATEVRDALRSLSIRDLAGVLRQSDLYPPGHALMLGTWMAFGGESSNSLRLFRLTVLFACIVTLWYSSYAVALPLQRRFFIAASAIFLSSSALVALSRTFMVEASAVFWALLSLGLMSRQPPIPPGRAAALLAATSLCVLTKYNVGLPLLPSAAVLGAVYLLRGHRRDGGVLILVTVIAALVVLLFLLWQKDGMMNFMEYARNRSNSMGESPFARLVWYGRWYSSECMPKPAFAGVVVLMAICGFVLGRNLIGVATIAYLVISAIAIARHSYVLDRNLVSFVAVITVPAGLGIAVVTSSIGRRVRSVENGLLIVLLASGAIALLLSPASSERFQRPYLGAQTTEMEELSRFVFARFQKTSSCRVIGTFNEFSPGWTEILWRRAHEQKNGGLSFDFPYPLGGSRSGLDARGDTIYAHRIESWANDSPEEAVITLDVSDAGPYNTEDFRLWNLWKRNDSKAIAASPSFQLVDSFSSPIRGVSARVFTLGSGPVEFLSGWGPAEKWGRWAMENAAVLRIAASVVPTRMVFRVAAYEGMGEEQECDVKLGGAVVGQFVVSGRPWQWEDHAVLLPAQAGGGQVLVELHFRKRWPGNEQDRVLRSAPFASITLETTR